MSEALSFWLDNKIASAVKIAEIGDQSLVDYRGKFYVIKDGAAVMKGSRPLHYSKSSMPLIWKKALRGETPVVGSDDSEAGIMPMASVTKRIRVKKENESIPMPESKPVAPQLVPELKQSAEAKAAKPVKKPDTRPAPQTSVPAQCPYCGQKQEIPVDKGKNGKPFFCTCQKCATDFAVRFVPVTMFQAQVAGFK